MVKNLNLHSAVNVAICCLCSKLLWRIQMQIRNTNQKNANKKQIGSILENAKPHASAPVTNLA